MTDPAGDAPDTPPAHLARPVARPDVEMAWFDGEAVLFDPVTRQLHTLNGAAAAVWLCCDGTQDVAAMTDELAGTFGVPAEHIAGDVHSAVRSLDGLGLLVGSTLPPAVEVAEVVEVRTTGDDDPADLGDVLLPPPFG